jgi:hypothetical protein
MWILMCCCLRLNFFGRLQTEWYQNSRIYKNEIVLLIILHIVSFHDISQEQGFYEARTTAEEQKQQFFSSFFLSQASHSIMAVREPKVAACV